MYNVYTLYIYIVHVGSAHARVFSVSVHDKQRHTPRALVMCDDVQEGGPGVAGVEAATGILLSILSVISGPQLNYGDQRAQHSFHCQ